MKKLTTQQIKKFQNIILSHYREHGRHDLPWRKPSRTAYQVLVSEIMLQQTQVDRVIPFFKTWMKHFPNFRQLAQAPQAHVLKHWKGLGYNSRALRLHKLAKTVTKQYHGRLPSDRVQLEALPGIGPYTAGAVRVFAFDQSDVFIETNIRRVFIHHFFSNHTSVQDKEIMERVGQTLPDNDIFDWYAALMDYGSTLPKILKSNPNKKSKHYTTQKKFEGSDRQIRGKILEILLVKKNLDLATLYVLLGKEKNRYKKILHNMQSEGFLEIKNKKVFLV